MKSDDALKDLRLNAAASKDAIQNAISAIGHSLPPDYVRFLSDHDGGEGFVGENYLILWKAEELSTLNYEYGVRKYAPELLLFGSNGSGEAYGFDRREEKMSVVRVPFIGMELRYATPIADTFSELLVYLVNGPDVDR